MRILILDFWFGKTHQRLNIKTINLISRHYDIIATSYNGYYDCFSSCEKVKIIETKCINRKTNRLFQRMESIYNIWQARKNTKRLDYDAILITGYEVISVTIAFLLFGKKVPIYLQYHQHVDQVISGLKNRIFNLYKNKAHHIFLEEDYAEFFIEKTHVNKDFVHVVHHPLLGTIKNNNVGNSGIILGISSSNDETVVKKIIDFADNESALYNNKIKIHLRSKKYKYNSQVLTVDNHFVSVEEYKNMFDDAKVIIVIPPKEEFLHRVSGTIYDAIASGKKVIGIDISIMRIMSKIAPTMFCILDDNDMIKGIISSFVSDISKQDLEMVRMRHSDMKISNEYLLCFGV